MGDGEEVCFCLLGGQLGGGDVPADIEALVSLDLELTSLSPDFRCRYSSTAQPRQITRK